mgnify:CR=1 FL=1
MISESLNEKENFSPQAKNEPEPNFFEDKYSTLFEITKSLRTQSSFIKFNNKLKLKLVTDFGQKTDSYMMALYGGMDQVSDGNLRPNYEVDSVIMEESQSRSENESFTS